MITRVVTAAALSNLGDGLRVVALPMLAASLTRDPLLVSGLTVASFVPWVLFGLPIGALVDRSRPEVFMRWANGGRAVLLTVLTVMLTVGDASVLVLLAIALLLGIGEAVYDNAAQSLVPRIIDDAGLEAANSALLTAERLGQDLVGPAVAGLLFAASVLLPFGLGAVLVAVGVLLLFGIRTAAPEVPPGPVRSVYADAFDGMRWLWREVFVRRLILVGAALTFATMFWESTLVLLATGPLGLDPADYGFALAAGAVGGVAGAVATPALVHRVDRWVLQCVGIGVCAAVDVALFAVPHAVTVALAWGGTGFGFAMWNVVSVTARQRMVPAHLLAKVNSASRTISISAVPLGALAGGFTADHLGLTAPAGLSAVALVALVVGYALRSRSERHLLRSEVPAAVPS